MLGGLYKLALIVVGAVCENGGRVGGEGAGCVTD